MKSGMLAAESAFAAIQAERSSDVLDDYEANLRSSWIATELQLVKNAEPLLSKFGNSIGTVLAGIDMWMRTLKIGLPFTMKHKPDAEKLWRSEEHTSELQSLMRISYAVFCLKKKKTYKQLHQ